MRHAVILAGEQAKPPQAAARTLWNAGIFGPGTARRLLVEIDTHLPQTPRPARVVRQIVRDNGAVLGSEIKVE